MIKRKHVIIEGKVQGVFFRAAMQKTARSLGITGWVRNLPDGRVEAVLEGPEKNMQTMLDWCHHGPPYAVVKHVEAIEEPSAGNYEDFSIRY